MWNFNSNDKIQKINKYICNMSLIIALWRKSRIRQRACKEDGAVLYKMIREGCNDEWYLNSYMEEVRL